MGYVLLTNCIHTMLYENQRELIVKFPLVCSIYSQVFCGYENQSIGENWSAPTSHKGQKKSSGRSSNAVPGAMFCSGTPTSGSYSQPHTSQIYFFIVFSFLSVIVLLVVKTYKTTTTMFKINSYRCESQSKPGDVHMWGRFREPSRLLRCDHSCGTPKP